MTQVEARCLNCDTPLQGKFCYACGQKQIEPHERTFKYLIAQFFSSAFLLEKSLLKNLWLVVAKPGFLAKQYVEGKQKRYIPPFSIFLLINFFYFIFSPLSDFNLSLKDQIMLQPYSSISKRMVDNKIKKEGITFEEYEEKYSDWSLALSKSLVILNVPITAFFLTVWFRKRKIYFADHFIYSLYFYAFLLLFMQVYFGFLPDGLFLDFEWIVTRAIPIIILLLYIYLSLKRFYFARSKVDPFINSLVMVAIIIITHFSYRAILFLTTYAII
jgi:hypothetical protein